MKAVVLTVFAVCAASSQTPGFEVVSVKPCKPEEGRTRGSAEASPGRLSTGCDLLVDENHLGLFQRVYVRFAGGRLNPSASSPSGADRRGFALRCAGSTPKVRCTR